MPLEKQAVSVAFVGGLETKTDPVLVDKAKLLAIENYSHNKRGTLARRDAWTALDGSALTGLDTQAELFAHGRELCAIDSGGTLKTYAPDATAAMPSRGAVPVCSVRRDRILRTGGHQEQLDSATSGGLTCFVWLGGTSSTALTGIYCSVIDESTGAVLVNNLTVALSTVASSPQVCVVNGHFLFVWLNTSDSKLYAATLAVGGTAIVTGATDTTAVLGVSYFEVAATSDASGALIVYESTTAGNAVSCIVIDSVITVTRPEVQLMPSATVTNRARLALTSFTPNIFMVACSSTAATTIWTATFTCSADGLITSLTSSAPVSITAIAAVLTAIATSSTSARVFARYDAGSNVHTNVTFTVSSTNSASAVTAFLNSITVSAAAFGPYHAAKAFAYNGAAYLPVIVRTDLQMTIFILDSAGAVVASALNGVTANPGETYRTRVTAIDANTFSIPVCEKGVLTLYGGKNTTQQGVSRIRLAMGRTFATTNQEFSPLWHAEAGGCVYLSGGFLAAYDGSQVAEAGFHWYPEGVTAVASGTAGNPNGTYQVCALYEWTDGQGRRHQSAPSLPVSVSPVSKKIDMTCPTLQLGVRKANASIVFYRTLASGTTFYRDSPVTTPIANSTTAATVSYTSDVTDAVLATNEILYSPTNDNTAGQELFHDAPPACRAIWTHQGRLFIAGMEDPYEFRYSQLPVARQGLNFATTLSGRIPEGHGGIVAGGVIDDKVIFYTPTRKFAMTGEGPTLAGTLGTYSTPQLIPGDVGCIDQRSLALVPDVNVPGVGARAGGLLFQSRHGLYLTERSLGDQFAGYPVDGHALGATVTSAVTLEDKAQLRVALSSGTVLVYDYEYGQWGTFTNGANIVPAAACVWDGLYTLADSGSGQVLQEAVGSYRDLARKAITGKLTTAWFKTGAINGFQRIWRFFLQALMRADSRVEVVIHGNYDETVVIDAFTIPSTATAFGTVSRQVEMRFLNAAQRCTAMRFTITDTPLASPWSGAEFSGITLEVGIRPGGTSKRAPMQANSLPAPTGQLDFSKPGNSGLVGVL